MIITKTTLQKYGEIRMLIREKERERAKHCHSFSSVEKKNNINGHVVQIVQHCQYQKFCQELGVFCFYCCEQAPNEGFN